MRVSNLTPVKDVITPASGVLNKVFVSVGQCVQKGAILAYVRMDDIQLDYDDTKKDFVEKIVELHCLTSLKVNKSAFKLLYDAQLFVDYMTGSEDLKYKTDQCERELLKNARLDQALEEVVASLEDQVCVLDIVVKLRGLITTELDEIDNEEDGGTFTFGADQGELRKTYYDKYFPLMQFAIAQQDLREARASFFLTAIRKRTRS